MIPCIKIAQIMHFTTNFLLQEVMNPAFAPNRDSWQNRRFLSSESMGKATQKEQQEELKEEECVQSVSNKRLLLESPESRDVEAVLTFEKGTKLTLRKRHHQLKHMWKYLFSPFSTRECEKISKTERESFKQNETSTSLVYGEVKFSAIAAILHKSGVSFPSGGCFVDLGSGSGRVVFAARLLHNFEKLRGIEILEGLHEAAVTVQQRFQTLAPILGKNLRHLLPANAVPSSMQFIRASFLESDWSDGDVVFANSTCFSDSLMHAISVQSKQLKEGAYIAVLTKPLRARHLKRITSFRHQASWGPATIHIYRRKRRKTKVS